jgi:hypothetical protein
VHGLLCHANVSVTVNVFTEFNLSLGRQQRDRKEGRGNQENDKTAKFICKKKKTIGSQHVRNTLSVLTKVSP